MTLKEVLKVTATTKIQINLWSGRDLSFAEHIESRQYDYGDSENVQNLMDCISWANEHEKAKVRFIRPRFDGYLVIDIYE